MARKTAYYVRVSTKLASQKDSPEHQLGVCRAFSDEEGDHEVVEEYTDRDTGTSIVARPDVQRMIRDAQSGNIEQVVFASLSRFSRDTLDSLSLKRMLVNALGIRVVSIEDLYDSKREDNELLFGVVSMVNQKQSEQISKSSRRGIKQSALNGNYTGSFAPYGYKKAVIDGKKKLLIDEEAAGHVKLIFDLYVNQKHGEKAVTLYLNEQNIPSPKKRGPWGLTTVQRILQNEVYTGSLVFNKYTNETYYSNIENMHDRRKKLVQRDPSEWIRLEEKTHEAIIDDDTFQRAQEIRLVRGGGKRGGQRVYKNVFAKLIFCQHCSSAMVTMTAKQQEKYRYLMCSRRRRMGEHGCRNGKWIPYYDLRDELIGWIIAQLEELIDDRNGTSEIIVKKVKERSADRDTEKAMKKLSKQLEDARRMLFELRRQKMLGDVDETQYNYEKEMYEKEISTLESKHAGMSTQLEKQRNIEKELDTLQAGLKELKSCDMSNVDELRIILSKLVKNITVDENGNVDVYTLLGKLGEGR